MKKIILIILFCFLAVKVSAQVIDENHPVQKQLVAYNNRDIDLFIKQYSDSVKVFNYPRTLNYTGIENMRIRYTGLFERTPELHCVLVTRMAVGDYVIDQEEVLFAKDRPKLKAIAIYKIVNNLIDEVTFITGN